MFERVYSCLTQDHDFGLVLLAAFICTLASLTTINLLQRALKSFDKQRGLWTIAAALASGIGIWSTHFIAMLAYDIGMPIAFDMTLTAVSIAAAVVVTGVGFAVMVFTTFKSRYLLSGMIVGLGISSMHFLGMKGLEVQGYIAFSPDLVAVSLISGLILAALALDRLRHGLTIKHILSASLMLTLAICALHFIAMGAVNVVVDPRIAIPEASVSHAILAIAISGGALALLVLSLVGAFVDQHLARRSLDEASRLRDYANASSEGIVRLNPDNSIADSNETFCNLIGLEQNKLKGSSFFDLFQDNTAVSALINAQNDTPQAPLEITLNVPNGEGIPVEMRRKTIAHGRHNVNVVLINDLRERHKAEARIRYLAHHDGLTELPNRLVFNDRLEHAIAIGDRNKERRFSVLLLDIDRFKDINDVLGHKCGDELLCEISRRLKLATRTSDTVSRLSGDEFAILQENLEQPEGAEKVAQRILKQISEPFFLNGQENLISVSIGIAFFPEDGTTASALIGNADTALYRAKNEGRATYRFFEAEMDTQLRERRTLDYDMRQAIANGDMYLYYQPQIETETGATSGFEALLRWKHPTRGDISPGVFIPIAEESGFIVTLGDWVLETACYEAASWPLPLRIGVNLSPVQFRHGALATRIAEILRRTGLDAKRLELEITESILIDDPMRAIDTLRKIKALGISIAMDDFGTGYSSLSYLQRFPFDKVKIDRSFVKEMETNPQSVAIVKAVIGLAHALDIPVVAEGVETNSQMDLLRIEGCDEVQGFLLGHPQKIDAYLDITGRQQTKQAV